MARGLDYYTGVVFDAKVDGLGAQDQVLGGGRYDTLISDFGGPQTPAVGFAFGLDRLVEAMASQGIEGPKVNPDVYVCVTDPKLLEHAFSISNMLRRADPSRWVEVDLNARKLNKSLQQASDKGADYAVIIGEKEVKEGNVSLKDLRSKEQKKVSLEELSDSL